MLKIAIIVIIVLLVLGLAAWVVASMVLSPLQCHNTPGSYECINCKPGEQLVNATCVDRDECANHNGGCSHGCVNTKGSYYCTCKNGFELGKNSLTCQNINECKSSSPCRGPSSRCIDLPGSYRCMCTDHGYSLGETNNTCSDMNECQLKTYNCPVFTQCRNTPGKYRCTCIDGYIKTEESGDNCVANPTRVELSTGCPIDNQCEHGCRVNDDEDAIVRSQCYCFEGHQLSIDDYSCLRDYERKLHIPRVNDGCPFGFVKVGGRLAYGRQRCYFVSEAKMTHPEAKAACASRGARLAIIDDKEQNYFIGQMAGEWDMFWMGVIFNNDSGTFIWEDETNKFRSWYMDKPTDGTNDLLEEYCVVSNYGSLGKWRNIPCTYSQAKYACSKESEPVSRGPFNTGGSRQRRPKYT